MKCKIAGCDLPALNERTFIEVEMEKYMDYCKLHADARFKEDEKFKLLDKLEEEEDDNL